MNSELRLTEADEIELLAPPSLTAEQEILVDLHSVINLVTVLSGCLELLDGELGGALASARGAVEELVRGVQSSAAGGASPVLDAALADRLEADIRSAMAASGSSAEAGEIAATIFSVLEVFRVRAAELQARRGKLTEWKTFTTDGLTQSLDQVLAAIEQNARGRYRIVKNIAQQSPVDYQVDLKITNEGGREFAMPPVLQDVLRDLVANARKYTPGGGRISAGIHAAPDGIRLVVEDNGIGIPRGELDRVAEYGFRATNALGRRTMGGGFGLTKALWVAKKFGGRMWLRSKLDVGTRVSIFIPAPRQPRS